MLISTKGRYALRVMIDLAEHNDGSRIPLMDVAERQEISEKYLEGIVATLSRAGLVSGIRGKGGGYCLLRAPADYSVGCILRLTEGPLAPVACLESPQNSCCRAGSCKTLPMWSGLDRLMNAYLDTITLKDLLEGSLPDALEEAISLLGGRKGG